MHAKNLRKIKGHFDDCTKEVLKGLEDDDSDTYEEFQINTDSETWLLNCCLLSTDIS